MNILLDTHTLLWFLSASPMLSDRAKNHIEASNVVLHVSVASLWELAIKISLGKLTLVSSFNDLVDVELQQSNVRIVAIEAAHLRRLVSLPLHHRDPFDRMLAVQAIEGNMPLISRDMAFDVYGVQRWW